MNVEELKELRPAVFKQIFNAGIVSGKKLKQELAGLEHIKADYPETFGKIFSAGITAGKQLYVQSQGGGLPEPGADPEFDQLSAEIDEGLKNSVR